MFCDRIPGGRSRRREQGWRYHSDALGYICPACVQWLWAHREDQSLSQLADASNVAREPLTAPTFSLASAARGFGLQRVNIDDLISALHARKGPRRPRRSTDRTGASLRGRGERPSHRLDVISSREWRRHARRVQARSSAATA